MGGIVNETVWLNSICLRTVSSFLICLSGDAGGEGKKDITHIAEKNNYAR